MDLLEISALVSILLGVSPRCERWFQRLHACGVSKKNLTSSGFDFFLVVMRQIAFRLSHQGDIFRYLPFSLISVKTVVAPGFSRLYYQGFSSLRPTSFITSNPFFLFIRQSPCDGFDFGPDMLVGASLVIASTCFCRDKV